MRMMQILLIHSEDNVAVALEDLCSDTEVWIIGEQFKEQLRLRQNIPFAHKVAIRSISKGEAVMKYGVPIAFATTEIVRGDWVHTHNAGSYFAAQREGKKP